MFYPWIQVVAGPQCECTKCHWLEYSKMINFKLCELHLNKKFLSPSSYLSQSIISKVSCLKLYGHPNLTYIKLYKHLKSSYWQVFQVALKRSMYDRFLFTQCDFSWIFNCVALFPGPVSILLTDSLWLQVSWLSFLRRASPLPVVSQLACLCHRSDPARHSSALWLAVPLLLGAGGGQVRSALPILELLFSFSGFLQEWRNI